MGVFNWARISFKYAWRSNRKPDLFRLIRDCKSVLKYVILGPRYSASHPLGQHNIASQFSPAYSFIKVSIMSRIITISLLPIALATPAFAAEKSGNIGVNFSFDNAFGIHGEFNIQKPVSLQVFLKNYARTYFGNPVGTYSYSYTAVGAAGIYDFSREIKFANKKIHPYAGLGLHSVSAAYSGPGGTVTPPITGGLYLTFGARYELSPEIDFDGNFNSFGGLTMGVNFKF